MTSDVPDAQAPPLPDRIRRGLIGDGARDHLVETVQLVGRHGHRLLTDYALRWFVLPPVCLLGAPPHRQPVTARNV